MMKRAVLPPCTRCIRLALFSTLLMLAVPGYSQSARFIVIDARDGLTPDVMEAYANAVGANETGPRVKANIRILASHRHGFDPGHIAIPETVRDIDLSISVMLQQGQTLKAPLSVNNLALSRRAPTRIKQSTQIRR